MKARYKLTDKARLVPIAMKMEQLGMENCEERFVDRAIVLDTEDYQDTKMIRFLNTVGVVESIDLDWEE